ncbi:MAG: leucine-rich repeat domain-containing protein [bacterium]
MKKIPMLALILVFGFIAAFVSVVCRPVETRADGIIIFADQHLEGAVRDALGVGETEPITEGMALTLTSLDASSRGIEQVDGLEYCTNLTELNLANNSITSVGPLSGLPSLSKLSLFNNFITDINPIGNISGLKWLNLGNNLISNIGGLSNLPNLQWLNLGNNFISDINLLGRLSNLRWLTLGDNPILNIPSMFQLKNLKWLGIWGGLLEAVQTLANDPNAPWLYGFDGTWLEQILSITVNGDSWMEIWNDFTDNYAEMPRLSDLPFQAYWNGGNYTENIEILNEFWQERIDLLNQTLEDISAMAEEANVPWADYQAELWNTILDELNSFIPSEALPSWFNYNGDIPAWWTDYNGTLPVPWAYGFLSLWGAYNNGGLPVPWSSGNLPWSNFYNNGNLPVPWAYGTLPWSNALPFWNFYQPAGGNLMQNFLSYIQGLSNSGIGTRMTFPISYQPGVLFRRVLGGR